MYQTHTSPPLRNVLYHCTGSLISTPPRHPFFLDLKDNLPLFLQEKKIPPPRSGEK
jgi:hypothetical protein